MHQKNSITLEMVNKVGKDVHESIEVTKETLDIINKNC